MRDVRLRLRHALWVLLLAFVVLAWTTNVSTHLQPEDTVAIKLMLGVQKKPAIGSFDDEIRVIRWAQAQTLKAAPGLEGIPDYADREPMDLLKAQAGLCYDRSRTLDKMLKWLGFETRHVYILFADKADSTSVVQFIIHALSYSQSHAVTEVKTSRGWMLVNSNSNRISLNREGQPVSAGQVYERRAEFYSPSEWVEFPLWAIRGMYSRKGQLYRPNFPFPEFNWPDFLGWAIKE